MMNNKCKICGSDFDDRLYRDCGGDCLLCMATIAGDPDCALEIVSLLKQERDELKDKLLVAESNLLSERYACAELSDKLNDAIAERDEAVALIGVKDAALTKIAYELDYGCFHRNDSAEEFASLCNEALSLTPSAALREIQARTIEGARDYFNGTLGYNFLYQEHFTDGTYALVSEELDFMAAAKRKGE